MSAKPTTVLYHGDCLEVLRELPDNFIDSLVSDPPFGTDLAKQYWDLIPKPEVWAECLRVMKPGGHALVLCGTRTQHRVVTAIEDGGFEIRNAMAWAFGSAFSKSFNISLGIDKRMKATGHRSSGGMNFLVGSFDRENTEGKPISGKQKAISAEAKQWEGWGTTTKPGCEIICVARKPIKGTVIDNILRWGTGGINIEANKVEQGTLPTNFIHDGSDAVEAQFPTNTKGESASRFFYCAKADKTDRGGEWNTHLTVKPTSLMRHLCRLVTAPGGVVIDPWMGSGSTGVAAVQSGFHFVGVELDADHLEIARKRLENEKVTTPPA